jgi:hypothetical protein
MYNLTRMRLCKQSEELQLLDVLHQTLAFFYFAIVGGILSGPIELEKSHNSRRDAFKV